MSLSQANHSTGVSKRHMDVGIPFGSMVSIPTYGDVPDWPASMQYFSLIEMDTLFLFDCHQQVVGATCRCFPDGSNEHFSLLPLILRVRITFSYAAIAMFMHNLSFEHSLVLKCGASAKYKGKEKCLNHKMLGRTENRTHHATTRQSEWSIECGDPTWNEHPVNTVYSFFVLWNDENIEGRKLYVQLGHISQILCSVLIYDFWWFVIAVFILLPLCPNS